MRKKEKEERGMREEEEEGGGRKKKEDEAEVMIAITVCQLRAKLAPWRKAGFRSPIGLLGVLSAT